MSTTLIFQADDFGLIDTNQAIIDLFKEKKIDSASCFSGIESSDLFQELEKEDIGLHLVFNKVLSYKKTIHEINKQYNQFLCFRRPTHLDSHGGTIFKSKAMIMAYIHSARKYKVMPLLATVPDHPFFNLICLTKLFRFDGIFISPGSNVKDWMNSIKTDLGEGIYLFIFHPTKSNEDYLFLMEPSSRPKHYHFINWNKIHQ